MTAARRRWLSRPPPSDSCCRVPGSCHLPQSAQAERQAAVLQAPIDELVLAGGQRDAALEAAVGNFQAVTGRALIVCRERALTPDHDGPGFEGDLQFVRRYAGKRDAERELVTRLVEVDGRLPARRFSRAELEKPALQLLRSSEQLQRFGPHPQPWIAICHAKSLGHSLPGNIPPAQPDPYQMGAPQEKSNPVPLGRIKAATVARPACCSATCKRRARRSGQAAACLSPSRA